MIFPNVTTEEWVKLHDLVIEDYPCPKCGRNWPMTVPFIMKQINGLRSKEHECGPGFVGIIGTPRDAETKELFRQALGDPG